MRGPTVSEMMMLYPTKVKRYMMAVSNRFLKDGSIKPQHLLFIPYIGEYDGISQKDLNSLLKFDKSYVSTVVRELIEMGLVYNDGPGKTYSLHLTDNGRNINVICTMMTSLAQDNLLSEFTREELEQFADFFTRLNNKLDRMLENLSDSENS